MAHEQPLHKSADTLCAPNQVFFFSLRVRNKVLVWCVGQQSLLRTTAIGWWTFGRCQPNSLGARQGAFGIQSGDPLMSPPPTLC
mmetsp:Transcript_27103/g.48891  ORF Transcript_27103/g.48891 Transcript_27103/m.48891 type:complete len:84 (+) Transcript_27103:89-340(+)